MVHGFGILLPVLGIVAVAGIGLAGWRSGNVRSTYLHLVSMGALVVAAGGLVIALDGAVRVAFPRDAGAPGLIMSGSRPAPPRVLARRRSPHSACINGCFESYEYCRRNQRKTIDCEAQLGRCFDFCDAVYLPESLQRAGPRPELQEGSPLPGEAPQASTAPSPDLERRIEEMRRALAPQGTLRASRMAGVVSMLRGLILAAVAGFVWRYHWRLAGESRSPSPAGEPPAPAA
jgi:hypothetical protein